jgi:deoxyhypusine synthase
MQRDELIEKAVAELKLGKSDIGEIVKGMGAAGGFGAKNFAVAVDVLEAMTKDEKCFKFISFPGCIVATGMRGMIAELIERGLVDAIITTCGTLDHDLARAWGGKYYHGSFEADDAKLREMEIYRLGNLFVPNESYGPPIEKHMAPILEELMKIKQTWSGRELIHEFGKRVDDENSILYQAAKKNIPVFVPGITDGAFGSNLVWFSQDHKFVVDLLADERELADIAFKQKITGALMVGGGISKHHTIWWNQFKGGLDYAVYVTTASQYDGSLSGARLTEAVSWGKVKSDALYVTVDGDATILLPFMLAALYRRLEK